MKLMVADSIWVAGEVLRNSPLLPKHVEILPMMNDLEHLKNELDLHKPNVVVICLRDLHHKRLQLLRQIKENIPSRDMILYLYQSEINISENWRAAGIDFLFSGAKGLNQLIDLLSVLPSSKGWQQAVPVLQKV